MSTYQLRAPSPSSEFDYPASALTQEPQPDKRTSGTPSTPFDLAGAGQAPGCHIPAFVAANPSTSGLSAQSDTLGLAHVLPARFLETADFIVISMTRSGTVVFADCAIRQFLPQVYCQLKNVGSVDVGSLLSILGVLGLLKLA
ncbi:hypothetical protein IFM61606_06895 [Aspergillus udagawae]|uniref:Uncharacterized protein n=1 Tax=Aspergillus udagawae TaxID=91492 RepID=A0A8E0V204_9EURO|nr:uncharacterized protein Aud_007441 [Aspergillus udagawae]GFF29293.1 hypothetical protein IFM51744_00799 [Aspergillus udagawae]GFF93632.1 hypothetical protein IFM53868_07257 [Aspergillus udagawae]GFG15190.1 hypothetical protein IFM5058_07327 [Aspergillus udagawae]GFG26890.1 hypothetical protein IFM61606_06895 [Aspergillus udagawae]GIC91001.1 hypothetical protein Aud_007441 [Aspergillus udagawae]